jgi:hypothetical protein
MKNYNPEMGGYLVVVILNGKLYFQNFSGMHFDLAKKTWCG